MPVEFWKSDLFSSQAWLVAGFTHRYGGVSEVPFSSLNLGLHVGDDSVAVVQNRQFVADSVGFELASLVCAEQIHGGVCASVTQAERGRGAVRIDDAVPGADALCTDAQGLLLTLYFADCVPIFFADPVQKVVAIAHAGWKGLVSGVVENTVRQMESRYGCMPESILAAIGPCIGPKCFEVGLDVAGRFEGDVVHDGQRLCVDLVSAAERRLVAAQLAPGHIDRAGQCTASLPGQYFSHRRDQGRTGRMAAIIGLRP